MTYQTNLVISGNTDVGACCACDTVDQEGHKVHKPQHTLYPCSRPGCDHYVCAAHRQPCGYCEGCCYELHEGHNGLS